MSNSINMDLKPVLALLEGIFSGVNAATASANAATASANAATASANAATANSANTGTHAGANAGANARGSCRRGSTAGMFGHCGDRRDAVPPFGGAGMLGHCGDRRDADPPIGGAGMFGHCGDRRDADPPIGGAGMFGHCGDRDAVPPFGGAGMFGHCGDRDAVPPFGGAFPFGHHNPRRPIHPHSPNGYRGFHHQHPHHPSGRHDPFLLLPRFDSFKYDDRLVIKGVVPGVPLDAVSIEYVDQQIKISGKYQTLPWCKKEEKKASVVDEKDDAISDDMEIVDDVGPSDTDVTVDQNADDKDKDKDGKGKCPCPRRRNHHGSGEYVEVISIEGPVDADHIKATLRDGVLEVIVPKVKPESRRIPINKK